MIAPDALLETAGLAWLGVAIGVLSIGLDGALLLADHRRRSRSAARLATAFNVVMHTITRHSIAAALAMTNRPGGEAPRADDMLPEG